MLKPRTAKGRSQVSEGFAGLLYSEDILNWGEDARERMARYSEVQNRKKVLFTRALMASVLAFLFLLALMTLMGLFDESALHWGAEAP